MRHILYISHSNGWHGAERVLVQQITASVAKGDRVSVLIPAHTQEQQLVGRLPLQGVTVLRWPYKASGKSWWRTMCVRLYNLPSVIRGIQWCREQGVDEIYSNTSVTILGAQIAQYTSMQHRWHWHEEADGLYGWRKSLRGMYLRWLKRAKTMVVFISKHQRDAWEKELEMAIRHEVVYNPIVPLQRQATEPHHTVRIGYLGNWEPRKNIGMLIRVYRRVHAIYPNTELWLCGAQDKEQLGMWGEERQLEAEGIHVMAAMDDVAAFYSAMDIFALPSLKEVMPLVSIEAMSCGVCTIQTSASAWNEVVEDGKDCLMVSPTDEDAWVEAISRCMDANYRNQIASNGLKKCKQLCES